MEVSKTFIIGINGINSTKIKKASEHSYVSCNISQISGNNFPGLETLQAYSLQRNPSFGRLRIDHLQNGAYVDEAKNVFFKLFTFQDVKKVFVEIKDKGLHELNKTEDGIFKGVLSHSNAKAGDKYRFKLLKNNGEEIFCKDPYSMKCESILDTFSEIYDHHSFKWTDKAWMNNKINQKISRKSQINRLTSLDKAKIYELNIATLTKEGSFTAAKTKIKEIAKDGIFNTIHIMPVESTYSYNWGYDGVFKFAPQDSFLGGPDKLKELIDYAHSKKINVVMDVVLNHLGPDGNTLEQTGPYINKYAHGSFGEQFNLEGDPKNNKHVRDYLSNICLNWLDNYHCEGLRLDLTKAMDSDFTLKQVAMEVHYHNPDAFIIAEDARNNMPKLLKSLAPDEECNGFSEEIHAKEILKADKNEISLDNLGIDSEWDFQFFHALNETIHDYRSVSGLVDSIKYSGSRIKYPMSHDEIGNLDGIRLITRLASNKLDIFSKTEGDNISQRYQRAAHATQSILKSKVSGEYDKLSDKARIEFLRKHYINTDVKSEEIDKILNYALSQNKLAIGITYTTPGPKMLFQGDEQGALSYFKFFREFSPEAKETDLKNLSDKGYEPGLKAFMDSKLDSISYDKKYTETMHKLKQFTKDLTTLAEKNKALESGEVKSTIAHDYSKVLGTHIVKEKEEIFTLSNFKDESYSGNYVIALPKGEWKEIINSNSTKYAGDGDCLNNKVIASNGSKESYISLPANSLVIFRKIS